MSLNPDAIARENPDIEHLVNEHLGDRANSNGIAAILTAAGFDGLKDDSVSKLEDVLRNLSSLTVDADELRRAMIREAVIKKLESVNISAPARIVDAAMAREKTKGDNQQGHALILSDPEPWPEPVDG